MTAENIKDDQSFKSLSDRRPRGLLDIFVRYCGVLPIEVDAEVEALARDSSLRR